MIVVVDINNINEGTSALHDNVLKLKELEKVPILICANKSDTVEGEWDDQEKVKSLKTEMRLEESDKVFEIFVTNSKNG